MAGLAIDSEEKQGLAFLILLGSLGAAAILIPLALSIAAENIIILTAILALVGFVVVFPFPKLAVVVVIIFAQVQYLFTTPYGSLISYPVFPVAFQWLDEVALLSLMGNLTLTKLLKGKEQRLERPPAFAPLVLMFLVGVFSARINGVPLLTGLIGQRYIFQMVILYLAIVNMNVGERYLRGLVYLLLGIGVFQALMGTIEFADKYRLYMGGNHDIVQGTWGGGSANNLGIFFLCLAAIVLSRLRRRWHGPTAVLFGTYVILLVLTSCRSGIVLALPVFAFILREKLKNPKYWIAIPVVIIFLLGCLSFYYRNTESEVGRDLGADEFAFQIVGRSRAVPVMSQVLRNYSRLPAFGAGPGTYRTAMGSIHGSEMFMQVEAMTRTGEVVEPFISASYAVVWMEYGVVGLLLFTAVLVRLFIFAWQKQRTVESPFWQDYLRALQAILIVYAIVGALFPLWTHFLTSIYLWLFPAIGIKYTVVERRAAAQAARAPAEPEVEIPEKLPVFAHRRRAALGR